MVGDRAALTLDSRLGSLGLQMSIVMTYSDEMKKIEIIKLSK